MDGHSRFAITYDYTQSSSLHISGLRYSDAGEYTCEVGCFNSYDVDCSSATGHLHLYLPGTYSYEFVYNNYGLGSGNQYIKPMT